MRKEPPGRAGQATFFSWTKVNSMSVRLEISSSYLGGEEGESQGERQRGCWAGWHGSLGFG